MFKKDYISLQPTNLYGENDNFNLESSHVLPALVKKFYLAKKHNKKEVEVWGSGKVKREFLNVDDLADACIYFLNKKTKETLINIGSGKEMKIIDYAKFVIRALKANLYIILDSTKPDGTPRKIVDSKIAKSYGWRPKYKFLEYLKLCLNDYATNYQKYKS